MARLPLSAAAVIGLVRELRAVAADERPLVVDGSGEVEAIRSALAEGGSPAALRAGGDARDAAALVYVLHGPPTEVDERRLRSAHRARVPIVCVQTGASADVDVPYVLATDVVVAPRDAALPVEEIGRVIGQRVGEEATALAAKLPRLRRGICAALVEKFARTNGLLALAIFLPGADLPALTLNQLRLVLRIGAAHGVEIDAKRAPEILGVIGAGVGLRAAARQVLGFVPVAGWAAKGAIAYAGTRALGEAAVRYFERLAASARSPS